MSDTLYIIPGILISLLAAMIISFTSVFLVTHFSPTPQDPVRSSSEQRPDRRRPGRTDSTNGRAVSRTLSGPAVPEERQYLFAHSQLSTIERELGQLEHLENRSQRPTMTSRPSVSFQFPNPESSRHGRPSYRSTNSTQWPALSSPETQRQFLNTRISSEHHPSYRASNSTSRPSYRPTNSTTRPSYRSTNSTTRRTSGTIRPSSYRPTNSTSRPSYRPTNNTSRPSYRSTNTVNDWKSTPGVSLFDTRNIDEITRDTLAAELFRDLFRRLPDTTLVQALEYVNDLLDATRGLSLSAVPRPVNRASSATAKPTKKRTPTAAASTSSVGVQTSGPSTPLNPSRMSDSDAHINVTDIGNGTPTTNDGCPTCDHLEALLNETNHINGISAIVEEPITPVHPAAEDYFNAPILTAVPETSHANTDSVEHQAEVSDGTPATLVELVELVRELEADKEEGQWSYFENIH